MKKVWITSLAKDEKLVGTVMGLTKRYGLAGEGHFWMDEVEKMAWQAPLEHLLDPQNDMWVIIGSKEDAVSQSVRFGLSLLALGVQSLKGNGYPIIWITPGKEDLALPTLLKDVVVLDAGNATLGAKLVARANTPIKKVSLDYRLAIHANPGYGLWFEVGPPEGQEWNGALCGVRGGEINFHGVGDAGSLPEKATLEYPMQGLKLQLGEQEFVAWAVQNKFTAASSYYVRVKGIAQAILFGPQVQDDEAEVHVVELV